MCTTQARLCTRLVSRMCLTLTHSNLVPVWPKASVWWIFSTQLFVLHRDESHFHSEQSTNIELEAAEQFINEGARRLTEWKWNVYVQCTVHENDSFFLASGGEWEKWRFEESKFITFCRVEQLLSRSGEEKLKKIAFDLKERDKNVTVCFISVFSWARSIK